MGKSDHVLIEINVLEGIREERQETYRNGRHNYGKTDWVGLRVFSRGPLEQMRRACSVKDKWNIFMRYYKMEGRKICA